MKAGILSIGGIVALAVAPPALAHHSFAMFDTEKTLTLHGTVKGLEWTNPHSWIYLIVQDDSGKPVEYSLEMQGPGQLLRNGWTPGSVKAGDEIGADIHPLKTGGHGGQLVKVVLPTGKALGVGGSAPNPFGDQN